MKSKNGFDIDGMLKRIKFEHLILFAFAFLIIFKPPIDSDLGWHLRWGEYILKEKIFPTGTIFSYNLANSNVADFYWGSQALIFFVYKNFGLILISSLLTIFASIAILISLKGEKASFYSKVFIVILSSMFFSIFLLSSRPLAFSTFLFATLYFILKSQWKDFSLKKIYYLPILFFVWANIHPEFLLGLIFFAAFVIVESFLFFFREKEFIKKIIGSHKVFKINELGFLTTFLLLSLFAVFLNPFGPHLLKSILLDANSAHLTSIAEWAPFSGGNFTAYLYYVYSAVVLFFLILSGKRGRITEILIISSMFLLSLRFSYIVRILVIVSAPFILRNLNFKNILGFTPRIFSTAKGDGFRMPKLYPAFFILALLLAFLINVINIANFENTLRENGYPVDASNFIESSNLPLKSGIFNNYGWGGYLVWRLPDLKVFIYGQVPAWRTKYSGRIFIEDYVDIKTVSDNFDDLINRYGISWFLISENGKLAKHLIEDNHWDEVYRDETAVIFKKKVAPR